MKKMSLIALMLISINIKAQKINLKEGTQLTVVSSIENNTDVGVQTTSKMSTTMLVNIGSSTGNAYKGVASLKKMVSETELMDRKINYDSDKKDNDPEVAKMMDGMINKKVYFLIDRTTGLSEDDPSEKNETNTEEKNAGSIISGGSQNFGSSSISSVFFVLDKSKKPGDKWTDSITAGGTRSVTTYDWASIENGIAKINFSTHITSKDIVDMMGMEWNTNLETNSIGQMLVDTKTYIVKKKTNTADITGTCEVGGSEIPITGTVKTETVVE